MILDKRVVVVMPAYNAARTLEKTYREIPRSVVDRVILVDDASTDHTAEIARDLGIDKVVVHERNLGYGGNQKTCYREALAAGADIVIMLHPDYQYTPALIEPLAWLIAHKTYDVAIGSRLLGNSVLSGGMPFYKFAANRILTLAENLMLWQHISEYHTGYRAFSREVLEAIPLDHNSNNFVFDNEMIAQIFYAGFRVGEISCPTKYFPEASSISFKSSVKYGIGVLKTMFRYRMHCWSLRRDPLFHGIARKKTGTRSLKPDFPNPSKELR